MKRITDLIFVNGRNVVDKPAPDPDRIIADVLEELHDQGHDDVRYIGWQRGYGYRFEYEQPDVAMSYD